MLFSSLRTASLTLLGRPRSECCSVPFELNSFNLHYGLEMLMSQGKSGFGEEKSQCGRDMVNMMGDETQQPLF